jgi:dipeptidase
MASDMLVALGRATPDATTLFAHNANRTRAAAALSLLPGRDHSPGDCRAAAAGVPEVRHTWAALVGHAPEGPVVLAEPPPAESPNEWQVSDEPPLRAASRLGGHHGVNEKGVAIGCTTIATRLLGEGQALTGPELVRLGLQRSASACQAVEVLTDLISRHGQGGGSTPQTLDAALLIADASEAYVLEAAGPHWALAQVGRVKAVSPACMLRQDWDRISRGLSALAISRGWWPEDGCKLDFAGAVGRTAPDHAETMLRWGKATMTLEQHSGQIDVALVRGLLRDLAEMVCPADGPPEEEQTASSFVVRLGPEPGDLPVAWCAFGPPAVSVYLPAFACAELPEGYGGRLSRDLARLAEESRGQARQRSSMRSALAELQGRLDEHLHDFVGEARSLHRRGEADELRRLTGSFMQHASERTDEVIDSLRARPGGRLVIRPEVLQGADF